MPRVSSRHVRQVRRVVEFGWDGQHWTTIYIYIFPQTRRGCFCSVETPAVVHGPNYCWDALATLKEHRKP